VKRDTAVKVLITLLLTGYLVSRIKPGEIARLLMESSPWPLTLIMLLLPFMYALRAKRWNILLRTAGIRLGIKESVKLCFIGAFYNLITPAKTGDLKPRSVVMPTLIWDKMMDVSGWVFLSIFSFLFLLNRPDLIYLFFFAALFIFLAVVLAMNPRVIKLVIRALKLPKKMEESYLVTMGKLLKARSELLCCFLLTLIFDCLAIVAALLVILALNKGVSPILALSMPIIALFGNIPISISGIGVRESVSVIVFSSRGVPAAYGFSFSLLIFLTTVLVPGIAGYFLTIKRTG
jgi:hypothetical protein